GVSVTMRSPSEKVNVTGTVPAVVVNRSVDSLTVARATASENLTITVVFGSTSVAPGDGFTSATVGGTTSRTVTVTDAATPWFPAASRARASSVRDPPVGGSAAKAMLNVSVRDGAAGLIVRVSVKLAAPVALRLISVTPTLSVACTMRVTVWPSPTWAPSAGDRTVTVGGVRSPATTRFSVASGLTFPEASRALARTVMVLPSAALAGTAKTKSAVATGDGGIVTVPL